MSSYLGQIVQVFHLAVILAMIGLTAFGPTWLLPLVSISWVGMLACFWLNRGCIVTRLENYLTGEDTTIGKTPTRAIYAFKFANNCLCSLLAGIKGTKGAARPLTVDCFLSPCVTVNGKNRNALTVGVGLVMLATALLRMLKK